MDQITLVEIMLQRLILKLTQVITRSSNVDIGLFLDAGNIWGVDYDSTLDDSNRLDPQQV